MTLRSQHISFGTHSFPLLCPSSVFALGPLGGLQWTNDETPFSFSSLSSKNDSLDERLTDMLRLGRTAKPGNPLPSTFSSKFCLWPFYLSGLLTAALGLLNITAATSSVARPPLNHPSALQARLCGTLYPRSDVAACRKCWTPPENEVGKKVQRELLRSPVKSWDYYLNLVMT